MMTPNPIVARQLEVNAGKLAHVASTLFLETRVIDDQDDVNMHEEWSHHFKQRILELSAALAAGERQLFTSRVTWSRRAMRARLRENVPIRESLRSLRNALVTEFDPATVSDALSCIDTAITEYRDDLPEDQVSQLEPGVRDQRLALLYLQSALEGDTREAMDLVLDAIGPDLSPADAITHVLLPAQREVGHLWHIDHVTVAEEHLVTATTHRLMAVIADRAPRARSRGKTAIAASVAGNVHDTGIRAIAYLLEMDGWRSIYLGSDLPRNDLPASMHFFDADVALLSIALSSQLPRLRQTISAIRETCDPKVRVLVGGNAFWDAPEAWRAIGADGFSRDAQSAVRLAAETCRDQNHH